MDGEQAGGGPRGGAPVPRPGARRPLTPPGTARVAALDALLRDIDDLRRTLETDLTFAAGAVDAGAPDLAASLLDGDRADLALFEQRALARLRTLEEADAAEDLDDDLATGLSPAAVVALPPRRRRSRLARLLPAAPMVAAAAALVGFLGVVPSGSSRPAPADVSGAVLSSWAELERLTASDAPPEQVQRAARDLNEVIATMVARADGDPAAARRALELLREAELVLAGDDDAEQLQQVLQQSRDLAARLLASLPPAPRATLRLPEAPSEPAVTLPAGRPSTGTAGAAGSREEPSTRGSARPRSGAAPGASRSPKQAPSATDAEPSPAPTRTRPATSASGPASPSASSSPSAGGPTQRPVLPSPVIDPI